MLEVTTQIPPELDPGFLPAALWQRAYTKLVSQSGSPRQVAIAITQPGGIGSTYQTEIFPPEAEQEALNLKHLERTLKFLLWQQGGNQVAIAGCDELTHQLSALYQKDGARAFDAGFLGHQVNRQPLQIKAVSWDDLPKPQDKQVPLGRHMDGCRIGFDLGGSDRKCAAVIDGEVVFSTEIVWDPYFQSDPDYHFQEINDILEKAAAHLPRVDAIGGSSAGIYVNNEVRAASLFRGIAPEQFEKRIRPIFADLQKKWGNIPFEVVNDGEVTALAGSLSLQTGAVLGIAMGTSEAVGYITPDGSITPHINELAFAPIDYRDQAPVDEWSGDQGCGVQYLSQQAVTRLVPASGLAIPSEMPFAEQLVAVQEAMAQGDERAARIYRTLGSYLGYAIAHYAHFYEIKKVLLLGRVTSGDGGELLREVANKVLATDFPELAQSLEIVSPSERDKRHGQAVAAASLPKLNPS